MKGITVVALGGNAILQRGQKATIEEQLQNVRSTCTSIADMIENGYEVVVTHGNGPQVGNILIQNDVAKGTIPAMPLDVCVAESQGLIGYMIQRCLCNEVLLRGLVIPVVTVLTQTLVRADDPAFQKPSKPVGPFYSEVEARRFMKERGEMWVDDVGRGWRRVVPSPEPLEILEWQTVRDLRKAGTVVIASGGGGIPVIRTEKGLEGVEAVIDKDLAAARLALHLDAECLLILTDVDTVSLDYRTPEERKLDKMTASEAEGLLDAGEFGKGSMEPKVRAAVTMARCGKHAIIASLQQAQMALQGRAGTRILPD